MSRQEKIRILVSGIDYVPNQFTRAIESYGCEALHSKGDPNGNYPRFCDGAIIVKSYTSHQRYWTLKDDYKGQGKPIWLAAGGFSEIKEKFETFLMEKRGFLKPPETVLAGELNVPKKWIAQEPKQEKPMSDIIQVGTKPAEPLPVKAPTSTAPVTLNLDVFGAIKPVWSYAKQLVDAGARTNSLADSLTAKGFKKDDGKPYTSVDTYSFVKRYKQLVKQKNNGLTFGGPSKNTGPKPAFKPKLKTETVQAPAAPQSDSMDLIQKISTSADLTETQKLGFILRISKGETILPISTESAVVDGHLLIIKTNIFESSEKHVQLNLSKEHALLVLENLAAIHEFTKG